MVPANAAPRLVNVPHSVSVHANVSRRAAPRACCSPWAATTAASSSTSRIGKLTYGYNYVADQRFKVQSNGGGIPEGDHIFSFEFTPTGKADIAKGKGVPAHIKLFVDGKPVGDGDLPVTIPLISGLSRGRLRRRRHRLTRHAGGGLQLAVHVHRHREKGAGRRVGRIRSRTRRRR